MIWGVKMLVEKLQTLSLRVQDEGQSFVIPVKKDAPVNITVQFSAFNIRLSGKVYRLNFTIWPFLMSVMKRSFKTLITSTLKIPLL